MTFNFNGYAYVLIAIGFITLALGVYTFRKGGITLKWFAATMLSGSLWSIANGFELASTDFNQIMFFISIEYFGIATIPNFWFLFCMYFSNRGDLFNKIWKKALLWTVPVITILLVLTNRYHHLHYAESRIYYDTGLPLLDIVRGPWYKFFTLYFYTLMGIGLYNLIRMIRHADPLYKRQNYSIIIAALIPWIANSFYLMGFALLDHIDVTPYAFSATSLIIFFSIVRFRLFEIVPFAREKMLDLMEEGFLVVDEKLNIIDHNKGVYKFLDISKTERLIGKPISEVIEGSNELIALLNQQENGIVEVDKLINGQALYYEAEVLIHESNKSDTKLAIIKFQDLSEIQKQAHLSKQRSEELDKLNQLKNRVFSIIAHDLRAPLVSLTEIMKMIAENEIDEEEFKIIFPSLNKDINYTNNLLENLLFWSKSQMKGFGPKKEFFNLRNLILREITQQYQVAKTKSITISHDIHPKHAVYADMVMLQTVIRNIVSNAIKFCLPNGSIHLSSTLKNENFLVLSIADSGIGIAKENLEKIFAEVDFTTRGTNNEKGTGLGMVICKEFLQKMGGEISVESELGKGTTFFLQIPLHEINTQSLLN